MPEIWEIADWDAVHFQRGILVFDLFVFQVLHRRERADLPKRWFRGVLGAEIAG